MLGCWSPKAKELWGLFLGLSKSSDSYEENDAINKQIKEADEINEKLPSLTATSGVLSYTTHTQAVYTSRLLNFKNLPEPKNADDNSSVTEYSGNWNSKIFL